MRTGPVYLVALVVVTTFGSIAPTRTIGVFTTDFGIKQLLIQELQTPVLLIWVSGGMSLLQMMPQLFVPT